MQDIQDSEDTNLRLARGCSYDRSGMNPREVQDTCRAYLERQYFNPFTDKIA